MGKVLYVLLAICVALLIYLKKGWEAIDWANLTVENAIVFILFLVLIIIGAIFLSPYLEGKKLPFKEKRVDEKRLYGGKDLT